MDDGQQGRVLNSEGRTVVVAVVLLVLAGAAGIKVDAMGGRTNTSLVLAIGTAWLIIGFGVVASWRWIEKGDDE